MKIKQFLKAIINKLGYKITKVYGERTPRNNLSESYSLLYSLGFRPNTIIDVGVAKETPELYRAFPDSFVLLVEPLREFETELKRILKKYRGLYLIAAAGSETREVTFNVHPHHLDGSSLYKETMGTNADGYERTVPMIAIDEVIKEKELDGPYPIKVDAQGAELNVLDGCQQTLRDTEVVVLEVSMFQFMKDAPQFHDVVLYMKERGFVAYDIILGWNRPLDNALGQIDVVFVKESGKFRENHSYATMNLSH